MNVCIGLHNKVGEVEELLRDVLAHFNGDAREKKANRVSFLFLYF
jgi:hypothetical protein